MRDASELTFIRNISSLLGWSTKDPTSNAIDNISDTSTGNRRSQLVRGLSATLQASQKLAHEQVKATLLTSILPKSSNKVTPIEGGDEAT